MYVLARKRFLTSARRDNRVPFHLFALLSALPSLFAYPFSSYIILLIRGHASSNAQHFKHSPSNLTLGILSSSNGSLLSSPFLSYSYFSGERCFFNDHPSAVSIRAFHNNNLCRHIRSFELFTYVLIGYIVNFDRISKRGIKRAGIYIITELSLRVRCTSASYSREYESGKRNKSRVNGERRFIWARTPSRKEAVRTEITNGIIIEIRRRQGG